MNILQADRYHPNAVRSVVARDGRDKLAFAKGGELSSRGIRFAAV
jgi:hypothetical protein